MASKSKPARIEVELEKSRCDSNWPKVLDLSRQLLTKGSSYESMSKFIHLEAEIEQFFLKTPLSDDNADDIKQKLEEFRQKLEGIVQDNGFRDDMRQDALLLLAKVCYCDSAHHEALKHIEQVDLTRLSTDNCYLRRIQLLGEAFAIKGFCLEKLYPFETRTKEDETKILECYEKSGDVSLLHLQHRQELSAKGSVAVQGRMAGPRHSVISTSSGKMGGQWNLVEADHNTISPLVEEAIQRSPLLCIQKGEMIKGIGRFRELLQVLETRSIQGMRQTLARQLAEVLLRGVSESTYIPVQPTDCQIANGPKPKCHMGDNLFTPKNKTEETLLLLLISESVASREALLNRSPEHTEARLHTLQNSVAVYDLLTLELSRCHQYNMLSESFERAMRFSFGEFHIWHQFALSLVCAQKYDRALLVLKECLRLEPNNTDVMLQASKLCYEHLNKVDEGLKYSETAVEIIAAGPMKARCYLYEAIGHSLNMVQSKLQAERTSHQEKALATLYNAQKSDPSDHLIQFHLARQLAIKRQINDAMHHVRRALHLRGEHLQSLHLLVLLLTADKDYSEASQLLDAALDQYPNNFSLLITKSHLQRQYSGVSDALTTCKHLLRLWKKNCEPKLSHPHRGTGLINRVLTDQRSLVQFHFSDLSDQDSGTCSIRPDSVAASKLEHHLSEVASSIGSTGLVSKQGPPQTWSLQAQIWLHIAEMFIYSDKLTAARACISEAAAITPLSHLVFYMRGRLNEAINDFSAAKQCYNDALAIHPHHLQSLQHQGMVLHHLGNDRMAEWVLRDAINTDPMDSTSWTNLGMILESSGDSLAASKCFSTALDLESSEPILSFLTVPPVLH